MRQAAGRPLGGRLAAAALLSIVLALAAIELAFAAPAVLAAASPRHSPSPSPSHARRPSAAKPSAARPSAAKPAKSAKPSDTRKSKHLTRPRPVAPRSAQPGVVMPQPTQGCPPQLGIRRLSGEPWAQQALDITGAWGLTRGLGVTVAVVDSGVDYSPQLAGRVSYRDLTGTGPQDCVGHGTAVASIIAASDARAQGIPFYGVAPAARILSVKVSTQEQGGSQSVMLLAEGIREAAAAGAQVINVSIQTQANLPALRAAVSYALRRDAVVVAAAGNDDPGGGVGPFYPASYPGVISVGAVDQTGALASYADARTPVSVTAPGVNIASAYPGGYDPADQGTSFAAAFVSGVAALVRSAYPSLTPAQVASRIEATAEGTTGAHTGAGLINPVQAVTAVLPSQTASPAAGPRAVSVPGPPRADPATRSVALSITGGAIAAAVLVTIGAAIMPYGRRRHWRPASRASVTAGSTDSGSSAGALPEPGAGLARHRSAKPRT